MVCTNLPSSNLAAVGVWSLLSMRSVPIRDALPQRRRRARGSSLRLAHAEAISGFRWFPVWPVQQSGVVQPLGLPDAS